MIAAWVSAVIAIVTFVVSVGCSAFIAGVGWGSIRKEVAAVNIRLARIEGMFTLRLKGPTDIGD